MYQIRNLLNRRNVNANVNTTEDFLDVVTTGYTYLTVMMSYLEMSSLDDTPSASIVCLDEC